MKQFAIMIIMLLFSGSLAGCTSDETEEVQAFPVFSSVADNQEIYDNARMDGGLISSYFQPNGAIAHALPPCMQFGLPKQNFQSW